MQHNSQNNQIVNSIGKWSENNSDSQSSPSEQLTSAVIQLFFDWKDLFVSKMKAEDWGKPRIEIWALALTDLQITPNEFEVARRKSLTLSWAPTAPADFLALARGNPLDNYPDMRQAYIDAANQRTDCPIAYETARRVGFGAMREQAEVITYPQWQKHYAEVCKAHSEGLELNQPSLQQIAHTGAPVAQIEVAGDDFVDNIRAILKGGDK